MPNAQHNNVAGLIGECALKSRFRTEFCPGGVVVPEKLLLV
jgi:hypothetical protein